MKISYTIRYSEHADEALIEDYVSSSLSEYNSGSVEQAEANAVSAQMALGRLVNILCEKNILTADDVITIAESSDTEAKLIK